MLGSCPVNVAVIYLDRLTHYKLQNVETNEE